MTHIKRIALCALGALALAARPAAAQGITSPIRYIPQAQGFSPFVGYMFINPKLGLTDSSSVRIGPQSAPMFGVQYQVRASGPLSVEATLAYIASHREVFLAEANSDSTVIRAIDTGRKARAGLLLAEVGFVFNLTGPRTYHDFAPFIGVDAGFARQISGSYPNEASVPAPERFSFGPSFAVGAKAGTDLFFTRSLSLRGELDGRLWRLSAPPGFRSHSQTSLGEWNGASSAQLGVVLHF